MHTTEQHINRQVTVGVYTMPYEADIVWSLLEAYEISVFPADYNTIYIDWLYSNALGGIKLRVGENDLAEASEVIASSLAEGERLQSSYSEGACPSCGNENTVAVVRGRQWAVFTWLIIGLPLVWPCTALHCAACGNTWRE